MLQAPATEAASAQRLRDIALMCCTVTLFGALDTTAKYLTTVGGLPVTQVVWTRFIMHMPFALAAVGPAVFIAALRANRPGLQWLRSAFLFLTTAFNFAALLYLQLDQTVTIFFLGPLLIAALAGPLLGEWVGWRRFLAICTGFIGVLFVVRPGFGGVHWAILFSFGAVTTYALYNIATRYLAHHDTWRTTLVYSPLAGVVGMAPFALYNWQWPADGFTWLLLLSLGFWGGLGHWLLILAHRHTPSPVLAPFVYFGLISVTGLQYAVFGDVPSAWTLLGGLIIVGAGLYLLYRERQVKPRPEVIAPPK